MRGPGRPRYDRGRLCRLHRHDARQDVGQFDSLIPVLPVIGRVGYRNSDGRICLRNRQSGKRPQALQDTRDMITVERYG